MHPLVLALISAAAERDPAARVIVPRLLAAVLEIARHLSEAERAEVAAILRESAIELEDSDDIGLEVSNGHHTEIVHLRAGRMA